MRIILFIFLILAQGCGYTMRGQERPFFEKKEIRTVYIPPVKNDTYKAGVEIMVYNTVRKRFSQWGYVKIVDSPAAADAVLASTVTVASLTPQAQVPAKNLAGVGTGPSDVQIATYYNVTLSVSFNLMKPDKKSLWSGAVTRAKVFEAATYLGALGTTSALINESQFDDTLALLATSVISDAEESINSQF